LADEAQRFAFADCKVDAIDGFEDDAAAPLQHAIEPRWRDVEIAREARYLEQGVARMIPPSVASHRFPQGASALGRPCGAHGAIANAVAFVSWTSQQAARVAPAPTRSGRSCRQRSNTRGQRGWKAHPVGMAVSRGMVPSICVR